MSDLDRTIGDLIGTIKKYVEDAATLTVNTEGSVVPPAAGGPETVHIATTVLRLDGDATFTVPVRRVGDALQVDAPLYDLHERSVKAATDYRAQLLGTFVEAVASLTRPGT